MALTTFRYVPLQFSYVFEYVFSDGEILFFFLIKGYGRSEKAQERNVNEVIHHQQSSLQDPETHFKRWPDPVHNAPQQEEETVVVEEGFTLFQMAQMANLHHRRRQRRLSGQELSRRNRFDVDVESGLLNGESNRVWHAVPYDDE